MTIRDLAQPVLDLPWYMLPVVAAVWTLGWRAGSDVYGALQRRVRLVRARRRLDVAMRGWHAQGRPAPPMVPPHGGGKR